MYKEIVVCKNKENDLVWNFGGGEWEVDEECIESFYIPDSVLEMDENSDEFNNAILSFADECVEKVKGGVQ
jgi:hypothetical protein